jgi:hypothetical protein
VIDNRLQVNARMLYSVRKECKYWSPPCFRAVQIFVTKCRAYAQLSIRILMTEVFMTFRGRFQLPVCSSHDGTSLKVTS